MGLVLKYVEKTKAGSFQYRRRVPKDVAGVISKREFKKILGDSERSALAAYPQFHAQVEREISLARRQAGARSHFDLTELEAYNLALRQFRPFLDESTPDLHRDVMADHIGGKYRIEPETGHPDITSAVDRHSVGILLGDGRYRPPEPTLTDALRLYLVERLGQEGPDADAGAIVRVTRDVGRVVEALGRTPVLSSITREDARSVRDYLLNRIKKTGERVSPASARRELNTIRAVINLAITEQLGLPASYDNPFNGLSTSGPRGGAAVQTEREKRLPLPPEVIAEVRHRLTSVANRDLGHIWRILEGTGARVAEVSGLRREDVVLDGPTGSEIPHIRLVWNEERRLKSQASIRHVPLVGDALEAAREALASSEGGNMLFPRYGRYRGSDAVSQILMKHVRTVTDDRRHTVHSLRHNMKDALMLAEISSLTQNLILGHALGGVGDRVYGGELAKLRTTSEALKKALGVISTAHFGQ